MQLHVYYLLAISVYTEIDNELNNSVLCHNLIWHSIHTYVMHAH